MLKRLMRFLRKFKPFDRRRHARFEVYPSLKCVCVYTAKEGQKKECIAYLVNISADGFLLAVNENIIYPQTTIEVKVTLPDPTEEFSLCGEVIRTYREYYSHNWYYSAVKFSDTTQRGIRLLLDFISSKS